MTRIRPYLPLIGFVLPTVIVGYGFVIPRSCIAGVNELSVGFGTTVLGAVLTYFAGQRAVLPPTTCSKPPLSARIARAINRQAAAPSGFFGRVLGLIWRHEHARLNAEVLDALDIRPDHAVLEIGSGPGHALREAARRARAGRVVGMDVSELMVQLARRRNRRAIADGRVELHVGDAASLQVQPASFDRIYSVHSLYFWRDLDAALQAIGIALKPQGKLVLAFRPESDDLPARFRDATYRFPRLDALETALARAGLAVSKTAPASTSRAVVLVAERA